LSLLKSLLTYREQKTKKRITTPAFIDKKIMVAIFLFLTTFCILKMAGYTDEATKNPKTNGNKIPYK
jgi:hypothetical protein